MRRSGAHIFLAVPTRGQIQWQTVTRLNEVRDATPGLGPIVFQPGNLSVALTRNRIVERFLATDCTVLAMVDDDVVPPPTFLETLDPWLPEYGIVGIPHPMPHPEDPAQVILSAFVDGQPSGLMTGMNDVDVVATGCVLIDRGVFDSLPLHPFRISHNPDDPISDDFLFCRDLHALGFKVGAWFDPWFCDHVTAVSLAPLMEAAMLERSTR